MGDHFAMSSSVLLMCTFRPRSPHRLCCFQTTITWLTTNLQTVILDRPNNLLSRVKRTCGNCKNIEISPRVASGAQFDDVLLGTALQHSTRVLIWHAAGNRFSWHVVNREAKDAHRPFPAPGACGRGRQDAGCGRWRQRGGVGSGASGVGGIKHEWVLISSYIQNNIQRNQAGLAAIHYQLM